MTEPARSLEMLLHAWPNMLLGTLLGVFSLWVGLNLARSGALPPVRWVGWWVRRVIVPLVTTTSWTRRTATIFFNNALILAGLVFVGRWPVAPIVGVACIGLSMGIALRILADLPESFPLPHPERDARLMRRVRYGVLLNLLEPPAIVMAIGLSMGQRVFEFGSREVWDTFAFWVVPLLLLAAGGEALWMGAARSAANHQDIASVPSDEEEGA